MQIDDVRKEIDDIWSDTAPFWKDEIAQKYKVIMIDGLENVLKNMQSNCTQMMQANEYAMRRLKEIKEGEN